MERVGIVRIDSHCGCGFIAEGAAQTNLGWLQIWKEKKWNFVRAVSVSFVRAVSVSSGRGTLRALSPRIEMSEPGAPLAAAASRATIGSTMSPSC